MSTDQPTGRVHHELGGADILVRNAGVMLTAPFSSDQREEHRRMVETNLLGAMTATEVPRRTSPTSSPSPSAGFSG
jgi:NADP-dependent 3-hydroxy acid dehydrogenase YdfG